MIVKKFKKFFQWKIIVYKANKDGTTKIINKGNTQNDKNIHEAINKLEILHSDISSKINQISEILR